MPLAYIKNTAAWSWLLTEEGQVLVVFNFAEVGKFQFIVASMISYCPQYKYRKISNISSRRLGKVLA
jgi:hypothetical protein